MDEELRYLYAPSETKVGPPPVRTHAQLLPFGDLSWPDFERLCLRLADLESDVEHAQLYGVAGQAQEGIDVYARHKGGDYTVYQCRRVESFTASGIEKVVDDFLAGSWRDRAIELVLCTSADLSRTELAVAVEAGNERLRSIGKRFVPWDSNRLSTKLKELPQLVLDFFDRPWLEAFSPEAAGALTNRLGPEDARELRRVLQQLYGNVFSLQDTAVLLDLASGEASGRFVLPDVVERRDLPDLPPPVRSGSVNNGESEQPRFGIAGTRTVEQRLALDQWLTSSPQHVLSAEAGGGKSSVLRFVALDLLSDAPRFGELISRWQTYLPVWIPFGFWVHRIAAGQSTSLTQAVRAWLESYDEGRLWPLVERGLNDGRLLLLVDGLDEWSDSAPASTALEHLAVFVQQRNLPILATSRPAALDDLGPLPRGWIVGSLASLTAAQQRDIVAAIDDGNGADFFAAVERSSDLRLLARTPLLLVLLRWLYREHAALPQSRFSAYVEVLDYLLTRHPKRRSGGTHGPQPDRDLKAALAAIAFAMQEGGASVMPEKDARRAAAKHLADSANGPGLNIGESKAAAIAVIEDARSRLGLLVNASPGNIAFLHRSFQEHLAAYHLSERPPDEQREVVASRAPEAAWRDVLLNLFSLAANQEVADAFITSISQNRSGLERWQLQPLLAEIVACGFGSASVNKSLRSEVVQTVETAPFSTLREEALVRLVDALDAAPDLSVRVVKWLPCLERSREGVFEAMAQWPEEQETDEAIWLGLFDEETANARAAGRAYVARSQGLDSARAKVVDLLRQPIESKVRAAALEALVAGWPDDGELAHFIERAHSSVDPNLRLIAHGWRIERGEQTDDDLADLLTLGGQWSDVDYERKGDLWLLLKDGWPRHEQVKEAALRTSRRHGSSRELELDLGLWLLLAGYGGDADVIEYCRAEIEQDDHPFLMLHFDAWKLLALNFRDDPTLVAALDEWMSNQQFHEPEVSYAALVGRTDVGKRTMIARLRNSSFPHWFVGALLEGWGMADPDVSAALLDAARGDADLAGRIGHYLPKILEEENELRSRLVELVGDETNRRPGLALHALGEIDQLDSAVVDVALARPDMQASFDHELWGALVRWAPEDARVRELAKACFDSEWYSSAAVARSYASDEEMRAFVRWHATPLPAQLRTRVAERLREGAGTAELATSVTDLFLRETDPVAASTEAQARVRRLRSKADEDLVARLESGIAALGPTYEQTRQAALTALIELRRLDVFANAREPHRPDEPVDVTLTDFLRPNLVLADAVVKHWDELEEAVTDVESRLSKRSDAGTTWDVLALVAEQSPKVRDLALRFADGGGRLSANLLHLYARARPRDERLVELCIGALGGGIVDRSSARDLIVAGAEILGSNFESDADVLARLTGERVPLPSLLMALSEGWAESDELQHGLEEARRQNLRGPWEAIVRVNIAAGATDRAFEILRALITQLEANPRFADRPFAVIVRRLRHDHEFVARLEESLSARTSPSEVASFARLLVLAGVLSNSGRRALAQLAEQSCTGELALELGLDIVAGRRRPLAFALIDALSGAGGG